MKSVRFIEQMNKTVIAEEIVVTVAAKNHNPNLLSVDFLKYSGIVPFDWGLASPPVQNNQFARIVFENGIYLEAQPSRICFSEILVGKPEAAILVPELASKYVTALPHAEYLALGISFKGYVAFEGQLNAANEYLNNTLLSKGPWQDIGTQAVVPTINLVYTLERGQLNLTISSAALRPPKSLELSALLFFGNFEFGIAGESAENQLQSLKDYLSNWQANFETYQNLVNQKFMSVVAQRESMADLFAMNSTNPLLPANSHQIK